MTKRGRKPKSYRCPWDNKTIDGLYRYPKGDRWRIMATGQEFREADERTAVTRFKQWQARQGESMAWVSLAHSANLADVADVADKLPSDTSALSMVEHDDGGSEVGWLVDERRVWQWVREQLLHNAQRAADMTGIPQLASLDTLPLPRPSIKLGTLWDAYNDHAGAANKRHVRLAWDELLDATSVSTLRELTTDVLLAYADKVRAQGLSAGYVRDKFQRVQRVIRFGLKRGMDATEIRAALDRCKVLDAGDVEKSYKPSPIGVAAFKALLDAAARAENDILSAALLVSLNCCMYAKETVAINWDDLDLDAGTLLTTRSKTGIIRTATLWPRTVAALRRLPMTPGAVFKSNRGAAYVANSLRDMFNDLRKDAGLSDAVQFSHIRDGAYTAAVAAGVEFALVQVLAGHKTLGLADHYIARNPSMVRDACDAVERHYFGVAHGAKSEKSAKAKGKAK